MSAKRKIELLLENSKQAVKEKKMVEEKQVVEKRLRANGEENKIQLSMPLYDFPKELYDMICKYLPAFDLLRVYICACLVAESKNCNCSGDGEFLFFTRRLEFIIDANKDGLNFTEYIRRRHCDSVDVVEFDNEIDELFSRECLKFTMPYLESIFDVEGFYWNLQDYNFPKSLSSKSNIEECEKSYMERFWKYWRKVKFGIDCGDQETKATDLISSNTFTSDRLRHFTPFTSGGLTQSTSGNLISSTNSTSDNLTQSTSGRLINSTRSTSGDLISSTHFTSSGLTYFPCSISEVELKQYFKLLNILIASLECYRSEYNNNDDYATCSKCNGKYNDKNNDENNVSSIDDDYDAKNPELKEKLEKDKQRRLKAKHRQCIARRLRLLNKKHEIFINCEKYCVKFILNYLINNIDVKLDKADMDNLDEFLEHKDCELVVEVSLKRLTGYTLLKTCAYDDNFKKWPIARLLENELSDYEIGDVLMFGNGSERKMVFYCMCIDGFRLFQFKKPYG